MVVLVVSEDVLLAGLDLNLSGRRGNGVVIASAYRQRALLVIDNVSLKEAGVTSVPDMWR